MRIILDENLPQPLRHQLPFHDVVTVAFMGWSGAQNGDLINLIDGEFDILMTGDKNLRYQENLSGRRISIIELPHTRLDQILPLLPAIEDAINSTSVGSYTQIE